MEYCWGYNPLILTFDPNFRREFQVVGALGGSPGLKEALKEV